VGQVRRPDEQDVHSVDRGDRVGVGEGPSRLDLDEPDDPPVDLPDPVMADRPEVRSARA
jgi:hypothetical protein